MSRFALVFALSLALTGSAMACGMYMPRESGLVGAFDAIDAEQARAEEARKARLAVNWVDRVGEVPYGSLPSEHRGAALRSAEAERARTDGVARRTVTAEAAVVRQAQRATPERSLDPIRAFLSAAFEAQLEPSRVDDKADTATLAVVDTGDAQ